MDRKSYEDGYRNGFDLGFFQGEGCGHDAGRAEGRREMLWLIYVAAACAYVLYSRLSRLARAKCDSGLTIQIESDWWRRASQSKVIALAAADALGDDTARRLLEEG